jgi:hypothetical protein
MSVTSVWTWFRRVLRKRQKWERRSRSCRMRSRSYAQQSLKKTGMYDARMNNNYVTPLTLLSFKDTGMLMHFCYIIVHIPELLQRLWWHSIWIIMLLSTVNILIMVSLHLVWSQIIVMIAFKFYCHVTYYDVKAYGLLCHTVRIQLWCHIICYYVISSVMMS